MHLLFISKGARLFCFNTLKLKNVIKNSSDRAAVLEVLVCRMCSVKRRQRVVPPSAGHSSAEPNTIDIERKRDPPES